MDAMWRTLRGRWPLALFPAAWVGFWAWMVLGARRGGDMDVVFFMVHPALPLLLGALIGWYRWVPGKELPGAGAALLAGGAITLIDGVVALALTLRPGKETNPAFPRPPIFWFVALAAQWIALPGLLVTYLGWYLATARAESRYRRRALAHPASGRA